MGAEKRGMFLAKGGDMNAPFVRKLLLFPEEYMRVDTDIRKAARLPRETLWDRDWLEVELETFFRIFWMCLPNGFLQKKVAEQVVSLSDLIPLAGQEEPFPMPFLGEPLFLKRDSKPAGNPDVHCLLDVCPHTGFPLCEKTQIRRDTYIECQTHGLTVGPDGTFFRHPAIKNPDQRIRERLSVPNYPLTRWNNLDFICRGNPIVPFMDLMRKIEEVISLLPLHEFRHVPQEQEYRRLDGNWKQHAENYMDSFHIRWFHKKGLRDAIIFPSYRTELYQDSPFVSLQWVYATDPDSGFDPLYLPDRFYDPRHPERRVFALWFFVLPNLALNFHPWGLSVNVYLPVPGDPGKTDFYWHHFVWDPKKYEERDSRWLNSRVDAEDVEGIRLARAALASRSFPGHRGVFGDEEAEKGPHWFHLRTYEAVYKLYRNEIQI